MGLSYTGVESPMVRIKIEQNESYDYGFEVDPEGTYEVSQRTIERWRAVKKAYEVSLEEMQTLVDREQEKVRQKEREQYADVAEQTDALAREIFGSD